MELIDKEKVIKEIKKVYDEGYKFLQSDINESVEDFKYDLLRVLDTLEAKEVDLERAIDRWICDAAITYEDCSIDDVIRTAKHFFELGMQQSKNGNNNEEKK